MITECKVCNSDKKDFIEAMILKGETNKEVADNLQAIGVNISYASINRHKIKHMVEHKELLENIATPKCNTKYDRNNDISCIDAKAIYNEIELQALTIKTYSDMAKSYNMLNIGLLRIVNNQMAITIDLQEKYMDGKAKYPHEQIRGLQIVQDMLQKLAVFSKDMFKHIKQSVENGNVKSFISDNAKQARLLLPAYKKGAMFKLMIEENDIEKGYKKYCKIYRPTNPYADVDFGESFEAHNEFEKGIEQALTQEEYDDYMLYLDYLTQLEFSVDDTTLTSIVAKLAKGKYEINDIRLEFEEYVNTLENKEEIMLNCSQL